jgi:hypothetical protein
MVKFSNEMESAFFAAKNGRRNLTKWINNDSEFSVNQDLVIDNRFSGRYVNRIFLPRFELYASSLELFHFGWIAWKLSTKPQGKNNHLLPLICTAITEFPALVISTYQSELGSNKSSLIYDASSPALILPKKIVTSSSISFGKHQLSFGIFDKNSLGYWDQLDLDGDCTRAIVITGSSFGLRSFAKSIMSFAVSEVDELFLCHGGRGNRLGVFSYEVNFYKHGSFGGDSTFANC